MRPKLLQGVWCALDVGRVYARGERRRDTRRPSWVAGPGQAGVPVCLWQNPGPSGHSCRAFPNLDQTSEIFPLLQSLPHRVFVTHHYRPPPSSTLPTHRVTQLAALFNKSQKSV